MKSSTITVFASLAALVSASWRVDIWNAFPDPKYWRPIIQSFGNAESIKAYVRVYMQPFRELQFAERSPANTGEMIKDVLKEVTEDSMNAIKKIQGIGESTFKARQEQKYRASIQKAFEFIEMKEKRYQPIFHASTIVQFLSQRVDDMAIVAEGNYKSFKKQLKHYTRYLKKMHMKFSSMRADKIIILIPHNYDMNEIEDYSAKKIIGVYRKGADLSKSDVRKLKNKLHTLGNSAAKLATSTLATFVSLAFTLLFFT